MTRPCDALIPSPYRDLAPLFSVHLGEASPLFVVISIERLIRRDPPGRYTILAFFLPWSEAKGRFLSLDGDSDRHRRQDLLIDPPFLCRMTPPLLRLC